MRENQRHTFNHESTFEKLGIYSDINGESAGVSVTRLGDFWKFFVTNFLTKVAQIFVDFWGYYENLAF